MTPRFKYNHWLPKILKVAGITLFPYILFSCEKEKLGDWVFKHELIHMEQINKDGICKFYFKYIYEYFRGLIKLRDHNKAYHNISYEDAAFSMQHNPLTDDERKLIC